MGQSIKESAHETLWNYVVGFIVSVLVYKYVVLPIDMLHQSAILVTIIFTITSMIRTYVLRRVFNYREERRHEDSS
jgi:uncharacterized membrane protein